MNILVHFIRALFFITIFFYLGCSNNSEQKPNILFIAIDDLRPELGCYENDYVKSPNIDRLAANGILFNNAYCQSAVCNPSRASLLTGKRPNTIKVWDLRTDLRNNNPSTVTLPQYFKNSGYFTVGIGKIYHNTLPDSLSWNEKLHIPGYPFDPDAVYRLPENIAWLEEKKNKIISEDRQERYIDRLGEWYLKHTATENVDSPDDAYFDGAQTDLAIQKLKEFKKLDKPFFFAIGYYRPHLPFNAPKKYWDMYDRQQIPLAKNNFLPEHSPLMAINNLRELRGYTDFKHIKQPHEGILTKEEIKLLKHGYLASVSYVDAQIGKLIAELDKLEMRENTIIVLWGDHGWKLGEHASWCKMTNHEIDTRVPLIISTEKQINNGMKTNGLVEFIDIYPTLCELSGLPIPDDLEGESVVPLMNDPGEQFKEAAYSQFLRKGIWLAPDGIEYMGNSVRTAKYRYTEWYNWGTGTLAARELYNQQSDPDENINIAENPENQQVINQLEKKLHSVLSVTKK